MKKIIICLCVVLAFVQCKRTDDILGPNACPSESFAVTANPVIMNNADSDVSTINFINSYGKITATFNEVITYKITLSTPSGAEYVQEGKGSSISLNWYGNSTNGKYFKQGDVVTLKVTNLCKTEPLGSATPTITIGTLISYAGLGYKTINFDESPSVAPNSYGDIGTLPYGVTTSESVSPSPQGGNYYKYKVNSVSTRSPNNSTNSAGENITWYFGGCDFFTSTPAALAASVGSDPTKVYLNFFARGKENTQAQMILDESVRGTILRRKFLANVSNEWKLYSVRLSDIGIINPSQISTFALNVGAASYQDTSAELDLDLVIFTVDKPF